MDSKNSLLEEIKKLLFFINDEFLISITNKGIVNRSKKDLEKLKDFIKISLTKDNLIKCDISNDISVIINSNIQLSKCTCPSQNICKHTIMCLLYIKETYSNKIENYKKTEGSSNTNLIQEYKELKEISLDNVISIIGKKDYNLILQSVNMKFEAIFEYGDLLTVDIKSQNVKVYFPKLNSIENSVCTCKEKGMCKHKSYALISYLIQERKMILNFYDDNKITFKTSEIDFLLFVQEYLSSILEKGLMSLTEYEIKNLEKLYQRAYSIKLFYMASELKSFLNQIHLYFNKNVAFSLEYTLHLICLIYNRATALIKSSEDSSRLLTLMGKRKEDKTSLDNINFIGLGTSFTFTKRKDLLLNAYFYCEEFKSIYLLSTLRPFEKSITFEYLYNSNILWSDNISFNAASYSKIVLKNAKLTSNRISNSKSTLCKIKSKTTNEDLEKLSIKDYSLLKAKLKENHFNYFEPYSTLNKIYLIKTEKVDNILYDNIEQKLKFDVYDVNNNIINFEIQYNSITENIIKRIENSKDINMFSYILGNMTEKNNSVKATFLCGMSNSKVVNFLSR